MKSQQQDLNEQIQRLSGEQTMLNAVMVDLNPPAEPAPPADKTEELQKEIEELKVQMATLKLVPEPEDEPKPEEKKEDEAKPTGPDTGTPE